MWQAQAETEGLTLLKADNKAGYYGVNLINPGAPKPFAAKVWRGGTMVYLGSFATAEEAALCIARSPEGRAAAKRAVSLKRLLAFSRCTRGTRHREAGHLKWNGKGTNRRAAEVRVFPRPLQHRSVDHRRHRRPDDDTQ
jgi:hypothetical protein